MISTQIVGYISHCTPHSHYQFLLFQKSSTSFWPMNCHQFLVQVLLLPQVRMAYTSFFPPKKCQNRRISRPITSQASSQVFGSRLARPGEFLVKPWEGRQWFLLGKWWWNESNQWIFWTILGYSTLFFNIRTEKRLMCYKSSAAVAPCGVSNRVSKTMSQWQPVGQTRSAPLNGFVWKCWVNLPNDS